MSYIISQQGLAESITGTAACTEGAWGVQFLNLVTSGLNEGEFNIEISSSITTSNATVVIDTIAPELTGLSNDDTPAKSKTWNWQCNNDPDCKYRHTITPDNESPPYTFSEGHLYDTLTTFTKDSGSNTFYLHVQAVDSAGNESEVTTVSALIDNIAPLSPTIVVPGGGTYSFGDSLTFTVTYNENIILHGGEPFIQLAIGAAIASANYVEGESSGGVLTFRYDIATNNLDEDGIQWNDDEIKFTGGQGSIQDQAGNHAPTTGLTIPSLLGVLVEHSTSLTFNTPEYLNGDNLNSYHFDGICEGLDDESLSYTISQQGLAESITGTATCTQGTWGVQFLNLVTSGLSEGEFNIEISSSITTSNATVVIDTVAPELTGLSDDDIPAKSKTWNWQCNNDPDCKYRHIITPDNDSPPYTFSEGHLYDTQVTSTKDSGSDTFYLHVQAVDSAGNESEVITISALIDNTAPSSPTIVVPWDGTYGHGISLTFTVIYNENITLHGGGPFIQLTIGTATEDVPYVAEESSGEILTFRYDIANNDLDGDGIQWNDGEIKFTGGQGSIQDQAGNHAPTTGLTIPSLLGVLVEHSTSLTFNTPGYLNGENENSYSFDGTCMGLDGESLSYTISQQGLADSITGTAACTEGTWEVQSLSLATSALSEGEFNIEISSSTMTSNATAVKDTTAPQLSIADQSINNGKLFSYVVNETNDISNLRVREGYTIVITNDEGAGITYNDASNTFTITNPTIGSYVIQGTISDDQAIPNSSDWLFHIVVGEVPGLAIATQTIEVASVFSYAVLNSEISGLNDGEIATIEMTSDGGSGMRFDPQNNIFSRATAFTAVASYTIEGTIADGMSTERWSFTLNVEDNSAPQLSIEDQSINAGRFFFYKIDESNDISNLRAGENYIIAVTDNGGAEITYNDALKTFSMTNPKTGNYTIQGTISNGQAPLHSSDWIFHIVVGEVPGLAIATQTIEVESIFSYAILNSEISGIGDDEVATIAMTSNGGSGVSFDPENKIFNVSVAPAMVASYAIAGTISDGMSTESWFFILNVEDTMAPQLSIGDQRIEAQQSYSYEINESNDLSNLREGESYSIAITDDDTMNITYNASLKIFTVVNPAMGSYTIRGTISDDQDTVNSSNWSFRIAVGGVPRLAIRAQTVEAGSMFSYAIQSSEISGIGTEETATIAMASDGGSGVDFDPESKTFSKSTALAAVESYTIEGTISDGVSTEDWSFVLNVVDTTAPQLSIAYQNFNSGPPFSYGINETKDISNLREGESYTVAMTDTGGASITYDDTSNTFTIANPIIGNYTIQGTIRDDQTPPNSSNWSFSMSVGEAPGLVIATQTVEAGSTFSHTIQDTEVIGIGHEEMASIVMTSVEESGVSFDPISKIFSVNAALATVASYTIKGTISDGVSAESWSFVLDVIDTTAPQLSIASQSLNTGQPFSYEVNESDDISNLREGESYRIAITDDDATGIIYNPSLKNFTVAGLAIGNYTIMGTINDNQNPINSSNWSFNVVVGEVPELAISARTIEVGSTFSYVIQSSEISGIGIEEMATIAMNSDGGSGMSFYPQSNTFSQVTAFTAVASYTIAGTITDGVSTEDWSFTLNVEDITAPQLSIGDQSSDAGQPFSYEIDESDDISNLRTGENYSIAITDGDATGITYNAPLKTFTVAKNLTIGNYTIRGTISDAQTLANSSNWSFSIVVGGAPGLAIRAQTVKTGSTFSYTISSSEISGIGTEETAIIAMTSDGGSGVSFGPQNNTFGQVTAFSTVANYTITGTITDGVSTENWSFEISVVETLPPPVVTGLSNDTIPSRSKVWSWECDHGLSECLYRFSVNTNSTHEFTDSDSYSSVAAAAQTSGDAVYYLHVQAKDRAGNKSEVRTVAAIIDSIPPMVLGDVGIPDAGWYSTGNVINFTVTFSEDIVIQGTPSLRLIFNYYANRERNVEYISVPGGDANVMTFSYTLRTGDISGLNGIEMADTIYLNDGSIKDAAGNDAIVTGLFNTLSFEHHLLWPFFWGAHSCECRKRFL